MRKWRATAGYFFLLFFLVLINSSYAGTIYVGPEEEFKSIQEAINRAVSIGDDTVFVYAGTYTEDITMKNGVTVEGESYARVTIRGKVFFKDANCTLKNVTVLFPGSSVLSYSNTYYTDWTLESEAGITVINSVPIIQNCVIKPDLDFIDPTGNLKFYGKAIQIWNMYENPEVVPQIEGNLIRDTDCGIYYFSQAFGGAINGNIKNNTFYHNKIGVLLRMHKENPDIYNNIFHSCTENVIHYTYKTNDLSPPRTSILKNNLLWDYNIQGWLDEDSTEFYIIGFENNITGDPGFIDLNDDNFYLLESSPGIGAGAGETNIGAYPEDIRAPAITIISPTEDRFTTLSSELTQLNIDISGSLDDDNGILSVYIDDFYPAAISNNDTAFLFNNYLLTFGLNDITITATDLAKKEVEAQKPIYLFIAPVEPPQ